jgi:hypothetical protein
VYGIYSAKIKINNHKKQNRHMNSGRPKMMNSVNIMLNLILNLNLFKLKWKQSFKNNTKNNGISVGFNCIIFILTS